MKQKNKKIGNRQIKKIEQKVKAKEEEKIPTRQDKTRLDHARPAGET
jgi:hypothetical protein